MLCAEGNHLRARFDVVPLAGVGASTDIADPDLEL